MARKHRTSPKTISFFHIRPTYGLTVDEIQRKIDQVVSVDTKSEVEYKVTPYKTIQKYEPNLPKENYDSYRRGKWLNKKYHAVIGTKESN